MRVEQNLYAPGILDVKSLPEYRATVEVDLYISRRIMLESKLEELSGLKVDRDLINEVKSRVVPILQSIIEEGVVQLNLNTGALELRHDHQRLADLQARGESGLHHDESALRGGQGSVDQQRIQGIPIRDRPPRR